MMARILIAILIVLLGVGSAPDVSAQPTPGGSRSNKAAADHHLIVVSDYSISIGEFLPPDSSRAVVDLLLNLLGLSQERVGVGVVFFGGEGVQVVGDDQGMPTLAHAELRSRLLQRWPELAGHTPMDAAFERVVEMINTLPPGSRVTIVLMTDGFPSSGYLRPDEFPEVQQEIDAIRDRVLNQHRGLPDAIVEAKLRQALEPLLDPESEEFLRIYEIQQQAEFAKTLKLAEAFNHRHARFVTLSFREVPPLKEIHEAAGGLENDLVLTHPARIIARLPDLRLTSLPRLVQLPDRKFPEDAGTFQRTMEVPLEPIGEAALPVIVFDPPLEEFSKRHRLTARVGGAEYTFDLDSADPAVTLMTDRAGNVITASLFVDAIPDDGRVTFAWESPDASEHAPRCVIYTFLRLRQDLQVDLRPDYRPDLIAPPITVSPRQPIVWQGALRVGPDGTPVPLTGLDAILNDQRDGHEERWNFQSDPSSPGVMLTSQTQLSPGRYDAELLCRLPSGVLIRLGLPNHIHSLLAEEQVSIDIVAKEDTEADEGSYARTHFDFGEVGDVVTTWTTPCDLRSVDIDYPLTVVPVLTIADSNGSVPLAEWFRGTPTPVTLYPGRKVRLRLQLTLPEQIASAIDDGLIEGRLTLVRADSGEPVSLIRFKEIAGAPNDLPVERITVQLRRPRFNVAAPWALHDWVLESPSGELTCGINVSIDYPFDRTAWITISHDSELPREVTVRPTSVTNRRGESERTIRYVPAEGQESMQVIPPGETRTWIYHFEMPEDCPVDEALCAVDVSGPGLVPAHVQLTIRRRQPLLAETIRFICYSIAALCGARFLIAAVRYLQARPRQTGQSFRLTESTGLPGVGRLETTSAGQVRFTADQPLEVEDGQRRVPRRLAEEQSYAIAVRELSEQSPVLIRTTDDEESPIYAFEQGDSDQDEGASVTAVVQDGGRYDRQSASSSRTMRRMLVAGGVVVVFALLLSHPLVLFGSQWVHDLLVGP